MYCICVIKSEILAAYQKTLITILSALFLFSFIALYFNKSFVNVALHSQINGFDISKFRFVL